MTKLTWVGAVDSPDQITAFGTVFPIGVEIDADLPPHVLTKLRGNSEFQFAAPKAATAKEAK